MIESKPTQDLDSERALLVGVIPKSVSEEVALEHLDELAFLTETSGAIPVKLVYQKLDHPRNATYLGTGKLEEVKQMIDFYDINLVIFDDELSPKQLQNLEKELKLKIIDRTNLILDIFATRAQTAQARTQVELAQYQYLMPRLKGMWTHLERQGGGIGTRGPGETEIETDRRLVQKKISSLKTRLATIDKQNFTQRKNRGEYIRVSLVGYTNVGKSTLMNLLSKSDVFAENKLFATLDTTTRKVFLDQTPFLLSDTVGFIRKLPHQLVESFKSTLDEVLEADLILHVVDFSHPQYEEQIEVVNKTLIELGVTNTPTIMVLNKLDLYEKNQLDDMMTPEDIQAVLKAKSLQWSTDYSRAQIISAEKDLGIDALKLLLSEKIQDLYKKRYPYRSNFY